MPVPSLAHLLGPADTNSSTAHQQFGAAVAALGPGYHCLRFRPNPLNLRGAPPVCAEKAYPEENGRLPPAFDNGPSQQALEARHRRRGQGEEEDGVGGVTLLVLARGDGWGGDMTARRRERARVGEAVASWGGEVVVVEYRVVGSGEGEEEEYGAGVRVLPFVVPDAAEDRCDSRFGDRGGRVVRSYAQNTQHNTHDTPRVFPLKAMLNMGLDAVRTRWVLPLDPAKLGAFYVARVFTHNPPYRPKRSKPFLSIYI